jgi:glucose uptake protein GlcU
MEALLYILGGLWIVVGTFGVLYTEAFRRSVSGLSQKFPFRGWAVVVLLMGGLLILSALWTNSFWVAAILGILVAAKGVVLFFLPKEKGKRLMGWFQETASEVTLRFWTLLLVILGVFLVLRV